MTIGIIKPVVWLGSSKKDLMSLSREVRREAGQALMEAQYGFMPAAAKAMKGFGGASVLEISVRATNGTHRVVYTVEMEGVIYVLHAWQKKSKTGIKTDKADIDLIRRRLARARQINEERKHEGH